MTKELEARELDDAAKPLREPKKKKQYGSPRLRRLGSVRELTMGTHHTLNADVRTGKMAM